MKTILTGLVATAFLASAAFACPGEGKSDHDKKTAAGEKSEKKTDEKKADEKKTTDKKADDKKTEAPAPKQS